MPSETAPPFGMSPALPAFDRATWLAKKLFGALDASIVLIDQGRAWRSRDRAGVLPETDPAAQRVMSTGEPLWVEDALCDPLVADEPTVTGGLRLRLYVGAPVRLEDGSTPGVLCVVDNKPRPYDAELAKALDKLAASVADECDRARAAEAAARDTAALETTRRTLTALVQAAPVSLMMVDREMRLICASPRWLASMDFREAEVIGRCLYDLHPLFLRYKAGYDRGLAGETVVTDRMKNRYDPRVRWLKTEMTPWRDEAGEIGGIIIAHHDITEMVEALDDLERSEQRLKIALDIADMHVWEMDYVREELTKSGAEDTFFDREFTFEELSPDTNITIDPRDRERIGQEWHEATMEGRPYFPEYRVARSDGKEVWAACSVKLVSDDDGAPLRMVGAMQNITARKAAEAELIRAKEDAEAANRAKSTFLATMSHEIRTPLNGVLGMAQAMAADELSPVQRERLDVVRQSGEALLAILNDVLDLSKIEAGKLELEEAAFDIADLARGAHAAFTAIANKKGLSFDLAIEPDVRGVWMGDSTRVRQILYNLVSNSLKFTEAGEVRVVVARAGEDLRMTVSDTGIGISPDRLANLFQKFEQADASTTRRYGGTGLGLAICRELATLMGGSISAESVIDAGTTFTVILPLTKTGDEAAALPRAESATAREADLSEAPLRVLAAEDNTVNQLVLKTLLHQIGIEPRIVDNGLKAVEAWEAEAWDVILMDVQMPEMDGPTAARLIRERERAQGRARTPIIALTANAMSHQVAEYAADGMDGFVAKPIEISRLFAALQEALAQGERDTAAA